MRHAATAQVSLLRNVHKFYNPMYVRISSTLCLSCSTEFYSYKRISKHLVQRSDKNRCHPFYLANVDPIEQSDLMDALQSRLTFDRLLDKKLVAPPPVKIH